MDLYIGNATKQRQTFAYRVPEQSGVRIQEIEVGTQIKVSGDLSTPQIDAIIEQHRRYGLVSDKEIDKTRDFAGLCYAIGRPISVDKLMLALDHNQQVLEARGVKQRQDAAIAVNNALETQMADTGTGVKVREFEMSVVEEEPRGGYRGDGKPIGEGTRVSRDDAQTRGKRRGRRKE